MENELTPIVPEPEPAPAPSPEPQPADAAPAEDHVDQPPDPASLTAEIDKLRDARKKAEEDAIYWRKQKAEARADYFRDRRPQQPEPATATPVRSADPEPKVADFGDYDDYVRALTDHRVKMAKAEWETEARQRETQAEQKQRMEALQTKMQEGFQRYADFEEITFDPTATHITPMVVDILADCDAPADVAYYLAKNRVEGVAISRMTPIQAARAIARIEAKIAAAPAPAPTNQPRRVSSAPAPIAPIGAGPAGGNKDPDKMTMKEYRAWRESQGARRF
jgi:hypothetical protein